MNVPVLDPNATAWMNAAWSWSLRRDPLTTAFYVEKLTPAQRDHLTAAAAVLIAVTAQQTGGGS